MSRQSDGRCYKHVDVVVSDLHLGCGPEVKLVYGGRRGLPRLAWAALRRCGIGQREENIDNFLEDFFFDQEFVNFTRLIAENYQCAESVTLRLLGDTFDPLTVPWEGKYQDPPYEDTAVVKMREMIDGHPDFFQALIGLLSRPNCYLDLFVGNHDLLLCWPKVQELLREVLTGGDPEIDQKLRFIDHRDNFQLKERGVLFEHGNKAEPHNSVRPENVIVTEVLGHELDDPILNSPYGSYMFVDMVTRIRRGNPLVGRVRSDRRVWNHAFRYRWLWGLHAGVLLVWHFVYSHFWAVADIRRKATLHNILDIVSWTMSNPSIDDYARQLQERNPDVSVVVLGHSHNRGRSTSRRGTYLNVGNWSLSYRLEEPALEMKWNRLPKVEFAWRAMQHFFVTGEVPFAWQMTKFMAVLAVIASCGAVVCSSLGNGTWLVWPLHPIAVKALASIGLVFTTAASAFKLFMVEPTIEPDQHFSFGLIRHQKDGSLKVDLMEYDPQADSFTECV
jgi:UDP-2,3-diacylglucosamine pyrophosphatase LpxH